MHQTAPEWVASITSVILALSIPFTIWLSLKNRQDENGTKGIGWQFIRFTVIATSIPATALLAINDALSGEASALLAGAMAYAFGKEASK